MPLLAAQNTDPRRIQALLQSLDSNTRVLIIPGYVATAFFGAFTLLITISTYILLRWSVGTRSGRIVFALVIIMYIMAATQWAIRINSVWMILSVILPGQVVPGGETFDRARKMLGPLSAASVIPNVINIILGDAIVVWRACVIWLHKRTVVAVAVFFVLCTSILYITDIIVQSVPLMNGRLPLRVTAAINPAAFLVSLVLNLWATGMIGCKLWWNRHIVKRELINGSRRTAAENSLVLLIESGLVYSIAWMLYFLSILPSIDFGAFEFYLQAAMEQVVGMYPTLIILLIALRKSSIDWQAENHRNRANARSAIKSKLSSGRASVLSIG